MQLDNPYFSGREWHFNEAGRSGGYDCRVDMIREADLLDDQPNPVREPVFLPPSVRLADCPACGSVAGKPCTDWTRCPLTGQWQGTAYVIEGSHRERIAAMVSA